MLSKANIKYIKSLQVKKYRKQEQCFVVGGAKSVQELFLSDFDVLTVFATDGFLSTATRTRGDIHVVKESDLDGLGEFQTNNSAIAVARMKPNTSIAISGNEYSLVLDDIRDPGNLGTIIRTADWYGIDTIIASEETADFYNPKVITSTMGSFTRVRIFYTDLVTYLGKIRLPIYGAFLDGSNVHKTKFSAGGFLVIGNESRGISHQVEKLVTERITIPRYGKAESLNAALATAIICDNIARSASGKT